MTDAQERAREALKSWAEDVDIDGDWLAGAVPSLLDEWGLSIVETGELQRLRDERRRLLAFRDAFDIVQDTDPQDWASDWHGNAVAKLDAARAAVADIEEGPERNRMAQDERNGAEW